MADTYTTNLNLTKPEPGAAEDTWGISLNADLDSLDAIFSSSGTQINLNPNQINFADGKKAVFGTGSDLSIYHDGFSSYIVDDGTGDLYIRGADDIRIQGGNGAGSWQSAITVNEASSVDLFHNGDLKAQTTSSGINIVGDIVLGDNNPSIIMNDSSIANLQHSIVSSSNKLQISTDPNGVHNSSRIEFLVDSTERLQITNTGIDITGTVTSDGLTSSGNLDIVSSYPRINLTDTGENPDYSIINANGVFNIYDVQNNSNRLSISSTGNATFTGTVTSDALKIVDSTTSNISLMEDGSSGADMKYIGSNNNFVIATGTGGAGSQTQRLSIQRDTGDISFYDDSGTTQGLFWDSSAESLGLGTTSPSQALEVAGSIRIDNGASFTSYEVYRDNILYGNVGGGSNQFTIKAANNKNINLFDDSGVGLTVKDGGNVGIGTDSPQAKLQIDDGDFYFKNDAYSDNNRIGFGNPARNGDAGYIDYIGHGNFTGHIAFGLVTSASNTAATEVARFDNAGNFGLGTSSPDTILEAEGATAEIRVTATTTNGGIGLHALSTNASTRNWDIRSNSSGLGTLDFRYGSSQGAAPSNVAMTMNSSGNVGIGTTSPNYLLDVEGSGSLLRVNSTSGNNIVQLSVPDTTSITGVNFGDSGSTNAGYIWYRHNGDSLAFTTAGTEALRILANGNVGIGTSSPSLPLSVAHTSTTAYATSKSFNVGGAVQIVNQSNTAGTFASLELNAGTAFAATASISVINENGSSNSASTLTFATRQSGTANIVEAMRIDSSGRVGIGTDSPSGLLEISADSDDGTSAPSFLITNASTTLNDGAVVGTIEFRNSDASGTPPHTAKIQGIANASDERTTELAFSTGSVGTTTEGMRLNSTGLGIGTDSPVGNLHVHSSTTESIMQMTNSSTGSGIADGFRFGAVGTSVAFINREAGSMSFSTSNTEAGRFDTSGNFLVAQSSIDTNTVGHIFLQNGSAYHIRDGGTTGIFNRKTSDGTIVAFQKDGSDVGSIGVDNSNNLYIQGDTTNSGLQCGTNAVLPHQSGADVDATIALGGTTRRFTSLHISDSIINDNASGVIKFRTNGSEAGRFDTSGRLLVGTTSDGGDGISLRPRASGTSTTSQIRFNRADTTNSGIALLFMNNTQAVGQISHTNTATTYATSSDARLKDVTGEARGLEVITKLNPVAYNWKADGKADEGLIAQEVKELVPNAVTGSEDEHYQMDYSKLVTHLVKGMKEQQEQIEFLKEEIANLKGE